MDSKLDFLSFPAQFPDLSISAPILQAAHTEPIYRVATTESKKILIMQNFYGYPNTAIAKM